MNQIPININYNKKNTLWTLLLSVKGPFLWNPNVREEAQLNNTEKLARDRERKKTIKSKWQE